MPGRCFLGGDGADAEGRADRLRAGRSLLSHRLPGRTAPFRRPRLRCSRPPRLVQAAASAWRLLPHAAQTPSPDAPASGHAQLRRRRPSGSRCREQQTTSSWRVRACAARFPLALAERAGLPSKLAGLGCALQRAGGGVRHCHRRGPRPCRLRTTCTPGRWAGGSQAGAAPARDSQERRLLWEENGAPPRRATSRLGA